MSCPVDSPHTHPPNLHSIHSASSDIKHCTVEQGSEGNPKNQHKTLAF